MHLVIAEIAQIDATHSDQADRTLNSDPLAMEHRPTSGECSLQQYPGTDFVQWHVRRRGIWWYPHGPVMRIVRPAPPAEGEGR